MKRASEKAIGLFVLISFALLILAIVMLGSASFFSQKRAFVMYFTDSVNGLNEGAPVKFRGVKIGQVKHVVLQVDVKKQTLNLPIIIEIDSAHLMLTNKIIPPDAKFMAYLISKGLRASLKSESLITGMLYIEMDFYPDTPEIYQTNDTAYLQIPTIPSSAEAMTNTFDSAKNAFNAVTTLVQSKELNNALIAFTATMNTVANRVDSKDLTNLVNSMNTAFIEANTSFKNINSKVDPLSTDLEDVLDKAKNALRSFTTLTDYLSRHPESLIQGKKGSQ